MPEGVQRIVQSVQPGFAYLVSLEWNGVDSKERSTQKVCYRAECEIGELDLEEQKKR